MKYCLVLSVVALTFGVACGGGDKAEDVVIKPGQVPTLRQLAVALSGGQTRPRCQDRGPNGEAPAGHVELVEWNAPTLLIQISRITPPSGTPHLMLLATDMPQAVPDIMCPHEKAM
jgi:hypothetical protein